MTSSLDWVGWVTAALGAAQALDAVRRRLRRRPARRPPGAGIGPDRGPRFGTDSGTHRGTDFDAERVAAQRPCGHLVPWVVRYEAADGSALTVWTARPAPDGGREGSGLW
ncbi:hypothetical protein [Streptomyces lavendofoliae]|uniref:hypothetical protein n=1 Tax=Streptomyces lavendofoliae TaxID=67314 RepID=UPI003D8EBB59